MKDRGTEPCGHVLSSSVWLSGLLPQCTEICLMLTMIQWASGPWETQSSYTKHLLCCPCCLSNLQLSTATSWQEDVWKIDSGWHWDTKHASMSVQLRITERRRDADRYMGWERESKHAYHTFSNTRSSSNDGNSYIIAGGMSCVNKWRRAPNYAL